MRPHERVKRLAGIMTALLVPGGIPLALGVLLAGWIWPRRLPRWAVPWEERT